MENGMNYLWFQHQPNMQGGDGLYSRMSSNQIFRESVDPELDHKTRRVSDKFSENINTVANEPSLAFFRIQEHVRKTLPQLVEQKHEVQSIQQQVQGACFDTEYATNAVKTMYQSEFHFQNIQELLKNAMFMKQQIGYEESRRASIVQSQDGSLPAASSTTLSATVSSSPPQQTNPTLSTSLPASTSTARAPPSKATATRPNPTDPDMLSPVPVPGVSPGVAAGPSGVVQSVMVNCHTDDIDVATEADEDISS
ncbi:BLOC-1-related complex subunit 8 homolog isoform X1 [Haliotis rubra]|uniref:BLOC-1-related complex subunit 8 homolog isoform X1 n=1 Tax=Haliotis rubra TaxID=36100 RepID=UPI001EE5B590|nr:BLOC-1-related complex subunit 8 homolog isoform X1 [Haliotis rubra]